MFLVSFAPFTKLFKQQSFFDCLFVPVGKIVDPVTVAAL